MQSGIKAFDYRQQVAGLVNAYKSIHGCQNHIYGQNSYASRSILRIGEQKKGTISSVALSTGLEGTECLL